MGVFFSLISKFESGEQEVQKSFSYMYVYVYVYYEYTSLISYNLLTTKGLQSYIFGVW